jgi:ABC-type cobalamin/Fe3+-siderophores transport system ATPase subunit
VLKDSKIYADGSPKEVITKKMIQDVYNVNAAICSDESGTFIHPYSTIGIGNVDYMN